MSRNKLPPIIHFLGSSLQTSRFAPSAPKNCVILLHGSGSSGAEISRAADPFLCSLPDTIVLYPTAPQRPYSLCDGYPIRVWHDRKGLDPSIPEDADSIRDMGRKLAALIADVNDKMNIPNGRIVVGGFSQGGHMAFHVGYGGFLAEPVAGVFALSSFLAERSAVYGSVKDGVKGSELPPLFMAHGRSDEMVSFEWGKRTFERLTSSGVKATFYDFEGEHYVDAEELERLSSWIAQRFPS